MLLQTKAALSPQLFKDPECWSGRGLNLRPPAQQNGANPTELTGRRLVTFFNSSNQICKEGRGRRGRKRFTVLAQ